MKKKTCNKTLLNFLFAFVLLFSTGCLFCQTNEIDSLSDVLKDLKEDTTKVSTLILFTEAIRKNFDYDKAMKYANEAFKLSEKINFEKGKALAYNSIGMICSNQLNYQEALKYYFRALRILDSLKERKGIAQCYLYIGYAYYYLDKNPEELQYFYKALKIFEGLNDQKSIAMCFYAIGCAYYYLKNYEDSEKNFLLSLSIREKVSDQAGVAQVSKSIGLLYTDQADIYYKTGNIINAEKKYTEALKKLHASVKFFTETANKAGILESHGILARLYQSLGTKALKEGDRTKSNEYFLQSLNINLTTLKIAEEVKDKNYISEYYSEIGNTYTLLKNYSAARKYLETGLRLSKEIGFKTNILDSYNYMVTLDSSEGDSKKAFTHYKQYIIYRDSLLNEERTKESTQAKLQYEFDKKEDSLHQKQIITQTKLDSQKKQKSFYLAGAGMLGLLSLFVFLNFRNQKKINKLANDAHAKEKAELELQSLRAQLNPHFMFNSLNAIQELILMEENEKSQSYLARFAKLLRLLLENADRPFIPLQRELDFLQLYLSLENLRIPDLEFSITVDSKINTEQTLIPNMILQPYIENAIWHGLSHKASDKKLQIRINNENGFTKYEIEDNGVGRKRSAELKSLYRKEHRSKGMELLSKRFRLLAKEYGSEVETTITDVLTGKENGTIVTIKVPNHIK